MTHKAVILDLSSDDDVGGGGWGDKVNSACGGDGDVDGDVDGGGVGCRDDGDWISEILDAVHKEKEDDSSDDVVVVGEVIVKPKLKVSKPLVKCLNNASNNNDDDDDDECVMLDGDPDKPISVQNDKGGAGEDDDSDDLLVVSEKGQVACRDYPHARHLCVKFPFGSTPHERHCDQCHCYVCDTLAPCVHWSAGIPSIDHCHATDKDEFWKIQRKTAKKINGSLPMVSGVPETSMSVGLSPPLPISSSLPSDYVHRYSTPNTVTCATTQLLEYYSRDKYIPQYVSHQLRNTCNNVTQGDRRHIAVNADSHAISRSSLRRKSRPPGVFPTYRYYDYASRSNYNNQSVGHNFSPGMVAARWVEQHGGVTPVNGAYRGSTRAEVGGLATNLMQNISAQANISSGTANYTTPQPWMIPRGHGSCVNRSTGGPQHQVPSSIFVGRNFTSTMAAQPAVGTDANWHCTFDNPFPFQSQLTSCHGANISKNSRPTLSLDTTITSNMADCYRSSFPAQPNVSNGFKNSSGYQSQVCSPAAVPLNAGENAMLQAIPNQSAMNIRHTGFPQPEVCNLAAALLNAEENVSAQTIPVPSNTTNFDCSLDFHRSCDNQPHPVNQFQNAVRRDEQVVVPLDGNSELPMYTNLSPPALQLDSWISENESGFDALGNLELSALCSEATVLDGGLFDL